MQKATPEQIQRLTDVAYDLEIAQAQYNLAMAEVRKACNVPANHTNFDPDTGMFFAPKQITLPMPTREQIDAA